MIAGKINRSDLAKYFKDGRMIKTFDQMQTLVFDSGLFSLVDNNYPDNASAEAGGVPLNTFYRTGNIVKFRDT